MRRAPGCCLCRDAPQGPWHDGHVKQNRDYASVTDRAVHHTVEGNPVLQLGNTQLSGTVEYLYSFKAVEFEVYYLV